MRRFYESLWNAWDDESVDEVLAPDFWFRGSLGTFVTGRDAWRGYRDSVRSGSPDFHVEVVDLVCDERRAAARLVCAGHHVGTLLGISGSGRFFRYDAAAFFTRTNSLLDRGWVLGDLDTLRRQLTSAEPGGPGGT